MTRKIVFLMKKKKKNAEAAAHFHIKTPKIAQVIIILRKFVREDLISVLSFLLDRHSIFIGSITGFRGHRLSSPPPAPPPPPVPTRHFHILCKYVNTYTGKRFCWHKWGRYAIKHFHISICFIVTNKIKSL